MAYDLEEQEKIASLKAWWDRYGNALTSVVLGVAVAVAGYNVWGWYQRDKTAKAGATYDELLRAVAAKDAAHVRDLTGMLLDKYPSTAYAEMGALTSVKASLDAGDAKTAKAQLQWTIEHAVDPEYRAIARVRMAGILLDEGAFDEARKQVAPSVAADLSTPLQASFADRRGDIDLAEHKLDDAKKEYTIALDLLQARAEGRGYANVVQLKLDGLMGGALADATPTAAPTVATPTAATPTAATPTAATPTAAVPPPAGASSSGEKK